MTTSKQYQKIKADTDKYNAEKKRINEYITFRYNNDEEYRQKILLKNREAYKRKKELLKQI